MKCNKRVCSIYDKKSYVAHIRALKQVLNHGLIIKQVHRVIQIWQDHIKPKYQNNAKICYMDPDSFIIHIKTKDFSKDIAHDAEKWYDASNYSEDDKRLLPRGINNKVIGFFKDELGRKIIIEFVALRP